MRSVAAASPNVKLTSLKGVAPKIQGVLGAKQSDPLTPYKRDALLQTPSSAKNTFSAHRALAEHAGEDDGDLADEEDISRRLPFTNASAGAAAPKTPARGAWTAEDGGAGDGKPAMSPVAESPTVSLQPPVAQEQEAACAPACAVSSQAKGKDVTPLAKGAALVAVAGDLKVEDVSSADKGAATLAHGGENADGNVSRGGAVAGAGGGRHALAPPPPVEDQPATLPAAGGKSHGSGEAGGQGVATSPDKEAAEASAQKKPALARGANFEEQKRLARERGRARAMAAKLVGLSVYMYMYICMHMYTYMCIYMHTHTHTHTHTHLHTHTHTRAHTHRSRVGW